MWPPFLIWYPLLGFFMFRSPYCHDHLKPQYMVGIYVLTPIYFLIATPVFLLALTGKETLHEEDEKMLSKYLQSLPRNR